MEAEDAVRAAQAEFRDALQRLEDEWAHSPGSFAIAGEEGTALGSMRDRLDALERALSDFRCSAAGSSATSSAERLRTAVEHLLEEVKECVPFVQRFNQCVSRARTAANACSNSLKQQQQQQLEHSSPTSVLERDELDVERATHARSPLMMVQSSGSELARTEFKSGYYGETLDGQRPSPTPRRLALHSAQKSDANEYSSASRPVSSHDAHPMKSNADDASQQSGRNKRGGLALCSAAFATAAVLIMYSAGARPAPVVGMLRAGKKRTLAVLSGACGTVKHVACKSGTFIEERWRGLTNHTESMQEAHSQERSMRDEWRLEMSKRERRRLRAPERFLLPSGHTDMIHEPELPKAARNAVVMYEPTVDLGRG